jgi:hypothetical protein
LQLLPLHPLHPQHPLRPSVLEPSAETPNALNSTFGVCSARVLHFQTAETGAERSAQTEETDVAKQNSNQAQPDGAQKDPDQWVTGDESMTGAQASYLHTLATEAGEEVEDDLTKAEASKKIDELQERTGRGRDH